MRNTVFSDTTQLAGERPKKNIPNDAAADKQKERFSFELFAPHFEDEEKQLAAERQLDETLPLLAAVKPELITVTFIGIGEEVRDRTFQLATRLRRELPKEIDVGVHATRSGLLADQIRRLADDLADAEIRHLVALGGNKTNDAAGYYKTTDEMVSDISHRHPEFKISVAVLPGRPDEIKNLRQKLHAGASRAFSQYSRMDSYQGFLDFREVARRQGVNISIVPGIMIFTNRPRPGVLVDAQGVEVPSSMHRKFDKTEALAEHWGTSVVEATRQIGVEITARQICSLLNMGNTEFHFYTLDRPDCVEVIEQFWPHRIDQPTRDALQEIRARREAAAPRS